MSARMRTSLTGGAFMISLDFFAFGVLSGAVSLAIGAVSLVHSEAVIIVPHAGIALGNELRARGGLGIHPLGIGLDVDDRCAVVDARGRASERIFAVGPMSQAAFWEAIAVPDIRLQAALLARRLTEQALDCGGGAGRRQVGGPR